VQSIEYELLISLFCDVVSMPLFEARRTRLPRQALIDLQVDPTR
jgi:hypothetical protein